MKYKDTEDDLVTLACDEELKDIGRTSVFMYSSCISFINLAITILMRLLFVPVHHDIKNENRVLRLFIFTEQSFIDGTGESADTSKPDHSIDGKMLCCHFTQLLYETAHA